MVEAEIKLLTQSCKMRFKQSLENKFRSNNTKDLWKGLQQITGFNLKIPSLVSSDQSKFANELNQFYARFERHDFHQ